MTAATEICGAHSAAVPAGVASSTHLSGEAYRNTYRVGHTAELLVDQFGVGIDASTIQRRMGMARQYAGFIGQYAPLIASYQRLHEASCAVERNESVAIEDFYIASAAFAADAALLQSGVVYRASFASTRYMANKVGMMRLARVCGYKCVGLIESEIHWAIRGLYQGIPAFLTEQAIDGQLATASWNDSVEEDVGDYLEEERCDGGG
ncbi:MAG: hypothetical protein U5K37_08655 [Natrialbaceae archaeon]|nr:hypothetical protein [Natrialbaceae archaeon]